MGRWRSTMTWSCIIQGHPATAVGHFCHAPADAYAEGSTAAGHEISTLPVAKRDFPLLRSKEDWDNGPAPAAIVSAQEAIRWAQHLLIVHPLWIGAAPALLKGFFEQALRPGFAMTLTLRGLDQAVVRPQRTRNRDHGHAGLDLSLVFLRSQPEEP